MLSRLMATVLVAGAVLAGATASEAATPIHGGKGTGPFKNANCGAWQPYDIIVVRACSKHIGTQVWSGVQTRVDDDVWISACPPWRDQTRATPSSPVVQGEVHKPTTSAQCPLLMQGETSTAWVTFSGVAASTPFRAVTSKGYAVPQSASPFTTG